MNAERVAVDGGLGIVDLADGAKVVLARAAAVGPGVLEREFIVDVLKVDSSSAQWAYLVIAAISSSATQTQSP